jgi:prevent-host-death family protein
MKTVSVAEAEADLNALIDAAEAGERVVVTRDGKPAAQLTMVARAPHDLDIAKLRAHLKAMTMQEEDGGTFMRRLRDEARY